jgi:hypothetical protein
MGKRTPQPRPDQEMLGARDVSRLTARVDCHDEDVQVLLALREPVDMDGPSLEHEGVAYAGYESFYSCLVRPLATASRLTWVMVGFEPDAAVRRRVGLPTLPGDLDLLAGHLSHEGEVVVDELLAVEAGVARLAHGTRPERALGDGRKLRQANGLLQWPIEWAAVCGIVAEQTTDAELPGRLSTQDGAARRGHEATISPESFRSELDVFLEPLGLLGTTHTTLPGTDPAITNIGGLRGWLRMPTRRPQEHDRAKWLGFRQHLAEVLTQRGESSLPPDGGPALILKCRGFIECRMWVMVSQLVLGTRGLLPACAMHMRQDPEFRDMAPLIEYVRTPIRVR